MKCNINVIKSVWRRLRKPSRATLDALCSKDAVYTEVFSQTDISAEQADLAMVGRSLTLDGLALSTSLSHLVYSNEMRSGSEQMLAQIKARQEAKMVAA
jgi:hypothetical protein